MSTEELFSELRRLDRADKLRAMKILVLELSAEEEAKLIQGTEYEVWSPYDSADAALKLAEMLRSDKETGYAW